MAVQTSGNCTFALDTPPGTGEVGVVSFTGHEEMSRLFAYELELNSANPAIALEEIVGEVVTLSVRLPGGASRFISGHVSRFVQSSTSTDLSRYRMRVVPWLWFLSRRSNCRIFQEMSIPDIIRRVFDEAGFRGRYAVRLDKAYTPRPYCVQYRESDLTFVSRLMEEEGIFYYFVHEEGDHRLILGDSSASYGSPSPEGALVYNRAREGMAVTRPVVTHLACEQSMRSTGISLSGYTFMSPATDLSVSTDQESLLERYDYPGRYTERSRGESYARIRLEEERMRVRVLCGTATDRRLASGHIYTLTDHPRDDLNTSYLLTAVHHTGSRRGTETTYECGFECIPAAVPFRPESITPKPVISGCQTAVVAGPAGEEVWIDKYGRVKVRFHWDRQGRCDDRSSCWVRVAQNWAGRNWGMVFHPRIGQEVVVQFLEGDPDRPLITGRVYNEEQMPPYELPANGSRSTIKSRSTPRGEPDNFNEIRFEDKKGEEQVFVQAEKDHVINVKNDQSRTVGNNRSTMIGNDESLDIKGSRAETIAKDETVSVGGDRHTAIDGTDTLTIKGDHSIKVGEGSQTIEVGANRAITISGNRTISVEGDQAGTVAGTLKSSAGGDMKLGADGNITIEAAGNVTIKAGGTLTIEASRVKVAGEVGVCSQDAGGGKMELAGGTAAISGTVVKLN